MIAVWMMQVPVDQIVDVVAVRHSLMSAAWAVLVGGVVACAVVARRAGVGVCGGHLDPVLVDVVAVHVMQVPIVKVVDVAVMADRGVAAAGAVHVGVVGVGWMGAGGHRALLGRTPAPVPANRCR